MAFHLWAFGLSDARCKCGFVCSGVIPRACPSSRAHFPKEGPRWQGWVSGKTFAKACWSTLYSPSRPTSSGCLYPWEFVHNVHKYHWLIALGAQGNSISAVTARGTGAGCACIGIAGLLQDFISKFDRFPRKNEKEGQECQGEIKEIRGTSKAFRIPRPSWPSFWFFPGLPSTPSN